MRSFFKLIPLILGVFLYCEGFCQSSKALIIGIDIYKPQAAFASGTSRSSWTNLDGCVNDATAIKDLVMAKYAFPEKNITTLYNEQASRDEIITQLKKLITEAQKGDVIFIYYAGHGSQMYNSLSQEADKKDETMVPADAYKGAPDIRDKELAAFFNQLLDKGVLLTVIFDSCHSGSVGRGLLNEPPKVRYIEENKLDAKDASTPVKPESKGALIFSAAQDFEFAKEQRDENGIPHGAFTMALLKALQQLSPDAPVTNIYSSVTAIMKYYGKTQEPVLAANDQRKAGTLFGLPKGTIKNRFAIGVSKIESKGVELQGGFAFGLSEGIKLAALNSKDTLEIIQMRGANKSLAKVLTGQPNTIAPGTLFEVINWASSKAPALKIYIPQNGIAYKQLQEYVKSYQSVNAAKKVNLVNDLTRVMPERVYFFDEGQWSYNDKKEGKRAMETSFNAASLSASLTGAASAFVNFPPSEAMVKAFEKAFSQFSNVAIVSNPSESQYSLVGSVNNKGQLQYGLIKSMITVQDTTESLPAQTDFVPYDGTVAAAADLAGKLSEYAFRIAKIRDWLMLTSPGGAQNKYPFKLSFQYYTSGQELTTDRVKINDTLSIYFQLDKGNGEWNRRKRYVYVFSIDSKGAMNLLFPSAESGNVENRLPVTNGDGVLEERSHLADILITPPAGADNYFMLTSEEAISNLNAFQQEGVMTRGPGAGESSPLEALLFTGTKTRNQVLTPVNWSIFKAILRTTE